MAKLMEITWPMILAIVPAGILALWSSEEIQPWHFANKIARALNLLGADKDLLNSDADTLIEDYFGDDGAGNDS